MNHSKISRRKWYLIEGIICVAFSVFVLIRADYLQLQVLWLTDSKWRNPDLREVIDYLNHQNDAIKANAAAYLQHLCYMDDNIKAQTRLVTVWPVQSQHFNFCCSSTSEWLHMAKSRPGIWSCSWIHLLFIWKNEWHWYGGHAVIMYIWRCNNDSSRSCVNYCVIAAGLHFRKFYKTEFHLLTNISDILYQFSL